MSKIMEIIEKETHGTSYHTYKYSYDSVGLPSIEYDDDSSSKVIKWQKPAETVRQTHYVSLKKYADEILTSQEPSIKYFLDGSRHVYKVDDILYNGRIYPVVAGQVGIGCCKRENKRMKPELFYREFVIALPKNANADGLNDVGFFGSKLAKINESEELKRLRIKFTAILPYNTSKASSPDSKLDTVAVARIQDYMVEAEKRMVADLVKEHKLGQDSYLLKDGSLEYKTVSNGREDLRTLQKIRHNYRWVIGVSKSFNPESLKDPNGRPRANYIADLPLFHRTPVALYENNDYMTGVKFGVSIQRTTVI